MCREEYEELALFLEHYAHTLENTEMDERFDVLGNLARAAGEENSIGGKQDPVWIELVYQPYCDPFEEAPCLAAATGPEEAERMRFCSNDKIYFLKDCRILETDDPDYYLLGDAETANITVSIDGRILTTDEEGRVEIEPGEIELTSDSRILIKGDLRG